MIDISIEKRYKNSMTVVDKLGRIAPVGRESHSERPRDGTRTRTKTHGFKIRGSDSLSSVPVWHFFNGLIPSKYGVWMVIAP